MSQEAGGTVRSFPVDWGAFVPSGGALLAGVVIGLLVAVLVLAFGVLWRAGRR